MLFCPKCGSLLRPEKKGNKKIMACSCGFKSEEAESITIKETVEKEKKIEVVEEDKDTAYPLVDQECPKCKHKKAYFWEIQTRASDEPATKFFKCEKCKHTWRDYN